MRAMIWGGEQSSNMSDPPGNATTTAEPTTEGEDDRRALLEATTEEDNSYYEEEPITTGAEANTLIESYMNHGSQEGRITQREARNRWNAARLELERLNVIFPLQLERRMIQVAMRSTSWGAVRMLTPLFQPRK